MPDDHQPHPTLDELYWHTDLPIAAIANRLGVPSRRMHTLVTPLEAGVTCYRCDAPLAYGSRSGRTDWWLRCRACRTSRRNPAARASRTVDRPAAVGGTVLVRDDRDIGLGIEACVDALASAGLAWDHRSLVVLGRSVGDGSDAVAELRTAGPGTLAVPSLVDLGSTQSERLQVLFVLTRMRWRVVAAADIDGYRRRDPLSAHQLDHLDEPYDDRDPWSPSWSEHLVQATHGGHRFAPYW